MRPCRPMRLPAPPPRPWRLRRDGRANPNNLPYLIRDYAIAYAYSSTLQFDKPKYVKKSKQGFLGFAPSYPSKNGQQNYFSALTYNQLEVEQIANDLGGTPWTGSTATESMFKQLAPKYRILHLAMHALVDDQNPLYSKLAFSPPQDSIEDGFLHTFEIFNLNLNSDLVVLSACNTGSGKLQKGEGVMSLARGFAYAGCPSILMSHWAVNDQTTVGIMKSFYKHLGEGLEKDEALQQAKLEYLQQAGAVLAHPYFWAGFVLLGDTSTVEIKSQDYQLMAGLSVILLIGLILLLRRRNLISAQIKTFISSF